MQPISENQVLRNKIQDIEDMFFRTEQIWITDKYRCKLLSYYCHISKNIRNEATYEERWSMKNNHKYISYSYLDVLIKRISKNYYLLPAAISQQTVMMVDSEWQSYFEGKEVYEKDPGKFSGEPRWPGYSEKDGEFILKFTNKLVWIYDGYLMFPKSFSFLGKIKTRLKNLQPREVRIVPKGTGYIVEIIYYKETTKGKYELDEKRIIGIDLGVENIIAVADNIGLRPIIVKGDILKSINQWYNKRRSELQEIYDRNRIGCFLKRDKKGNIRYLTKKTGYKMNVLTDNRNRSVMDILHKLSRWIIEYALELKAKIIVIGHNPFWKQQIKLGKRNNQNFVNIPHSKLIDMVKYKGNDVGINVVDPTEEYTSKCSFLDDEEIYHHDIYIGKRIFRGLFRSTKGILIGNKIINEINSDIQGAYNLIRKVFSTFPAKAGHVYPKFSIDTIIEGVAVHGLVPKRLSISDLMMASYHDLGMSHRLNVGDINYVNN